ncbi:hypothetical protein EDD16DRAFT_1702327 [Pisolithus croceorrhizus]|nr:hypothetical protein EV401DRAFT_1167143 [Pisolithus croceorrhizus]KAI6127592.1 hypothetical protein EDD16DRAFT_1702327 [Pisolithus croceorrhizus]KAI6140361.1 hypothetical protein EDD17DRAFT_1669377 [Pisolithus thermaeus]
MATARLLLWIFMVFTCLRYLEIPLAHRHAATHTLESFCGVTSNNLELTLDDSPLGFPAGDSLVASVAKAYLAISKLPVETDWTNDLTAFHLLVICRATTNFKVSLQQYLSRLDTVIGVSNVCLAITTQRNLFVAVLHSAFELELQLDELERYLTDLTAPSSESFIIARRHTLEGLVRARQDILMLSDELERSIARI